MTPPMAHVLVPLLVVMATAAPLAEKAGGGEQVVNIQSDSNTVDRAKRAKEEIVFGNQQNGARLGAAKKSMPLFLSEQEQQQAPMFSSQASQDKAGAMFAESQREEPPMAMAPEAKLEPPPVLPLLHEGGAQGEGEGQQSREGEGEGGEKQVPVVPVVEGGADQPVVPAEDNAGEESEEAASGQEPEVESPEVAPEQNAVVESNAVPQEPVPEIASIVGSNPPLNSENADAEEALQRGETNESDDVESFLKELHENPGNREEDEESKEEGSAEEELKQVANESQDNKEVDVIDTDSSDYTQNLLKYILLHGDDYARPVNYGYPYPHSYYLQRRRRSSSARRRLSHLHRRHSGKQLARAKRTKRDLFDDDLYYARPDAPEQDFSDEERAADMQELIAYLMALYPSLYENAEPPRDTNYPGYLWYANNGYGEEGAPEWEGWGEPEYMEVPAGWEPNEVETPAWEPAFYPEEVEEPAFYPTPAKRQMLSMVPGSRRKRYFYPFAREPYTHWGAFVPSQEKRDYDAAYWRLKKLATFLADSPSPYVDDFQDYKKK